MQMVAAREKPAPIVPGAMQSLPVDSLGVRIDGPSGKQLVKFEEMWIIRRNIARVDVKDSKWTSIHGQDA
jgi:hypothetical protein